MTIGQTDSPHFILQNNVTANGTSDETAPISQGGVDGGSFVYRVLIAGTATVQLQSQGIGEVGWTNTGASITATNVGLVMDAGHGTKYRDVVTAIGGGSTVFTSLGRIA